jgi:hypothetical protein
VQDPAVVFQAGDVVKVLEDVTARDFEGEKLFLPAGTQGTVVEVAESEFQLEIECVLENELAVAVVQDDQVELVWRERE